MRCLPWGWLAFCSFSFPSFHLRPALRRKRPLGQAPRRALNIYRKWKDGQGHSSTRTEHVILESGTEYAPLLEQAYEPEVRGVAVVCEGGDDILVIGRITELVSVVLGIPTNRICVTKML